MALRRHLGDELATQVTRAALQRWMPQNQSSSLSTIRPWRSGGFSDVYELPTAGKGQRRLLRLTYVTHADHNQEKMQKLARTASAVHRMGGSLLPQRYAFKVHTLIVDQDSGLESYVFESVLERLSVIPYVEWRRHFDTPNALLVRLLRAGQELYRRGIVHRDISHNNVVLTHQGFKFIDTDDSCIYPDGVMCTEPLVGGTPSYPLAEVDNMAGEFSPMIPAYQIARPSQSKPGIGRKYTGTPAYKASPLQMVHNMVHGLCILGLAAITDQSNGGMFILKYVRTQGLGLPQRWQAFVELVCTMDVDERMDFAEALRIAQNELDLLLWSDDSAAAFVDSKMAARFSFSRSSGSSSSSRSKRPRTPTADL